MKKTSRDFPHSNRPSSWVHAAWIGVFVVWTAVLSGAISNQTGTPGLRQSLELSQVIRQKETELKLLEKEIELLTHAETQMKQNTWFQEKEVRRILGYVADDEILFEFSDQPQ